MSYWRYSKKQEADDLKKVEISFLKKHGYLGTVSLSGTIRWSRNGENTGNISVVSQITSEPHIRFIYTQTDRSTDEKTDYDYKIPLVTTPCRFGGVRYWFQCPWYANGVHCGRRVGVLYLGGKYFACRHCYNLTYNSRNLGGISKLIGQIISITELDNLKNDVKRKWYAGKMTRRFKHYLYKEWKSMRQMTMIGNGLYRRDTNTEV